MMTPEGAQAQGPESGGTEQVMEGVTMLKGGTEALLQGLEQSGAPKEAVALAQQAAQAIAQLAQMMGGGQGPEGPGEDVGVGGPA